MSDLLQSLIELLGFASPRDTAAIERRSVSEVYESIACGEYEGVYKDGRSTRIPLESIRKRREHLPAWQDAKGRAFGKTAR